jgi:hypothetical protein
MRSSEAKKLARNPAACAALVFYLALLLLATWKHTFWRDESQVWLMARDNGLRSLMAAMRYEGHPPLWHLVVWGITRLSWDENWMKAPNLLATLAAAWMIVTSRQLAVWVRPGVVFSYFFLFEFGLIDRNYMLGIALLIAAALSMLKLRADLWVSVGLALAAMTSLPALEVSGCLYAFYLWPKEGFRRAHAEGWPEWNRRRWLALLLYVAVVAFCVWILRPPPDAATNVFRDHSSQWVRLRRAFGDIPRAYFPVPGAKLRFWNLTVFDGWRASVVQLFGVMLAGVLAVFFRAGKERWFFLGSSVMVLAVTAVLPGAFLRHVGWLFVVFVLALLLTPAQRQAAGWRRWVLGAVLAVQAGAGIYAAAVSVVYPFSSSRAVVEYLQQQSLTGAPLVFSPGVVGESVLAEMQRRSAYFPEYRGQGSFVVWNEALIFANHVPSHTDLQAMSTGGQAALVLTEAPLTAAEQQQMGVRLLKAFPEEIAYLYPYCLYQWVDGPA